MRAACDPAEQFALYSGRVAFLVAPHADVAGAMRVAAASFATRWKGLLSFAAEGDLAPAPDGHRDREIVLEVRGYPPTKNEAKSLLSEGHTQFTRVGALLEQAQCALSAGAVPLTAERIGVELVVRGQLKHLRMRPTTSAASATSFKRRRTAVPSTTWGRSRPSRFSRTTDRSAK
jgi:hypothetical protein